MNRPVRILFVDGPEHGVTRAFESEPPPVWYTPGEVAMQGVYAGPEPLPASPPVNVYRRTYKTRRGVWIFEWDGLK